MVALRRWTACRDLIRSAATFVVLLVVSSALCAEPFVRADANCDGVIDVSDGVFSLLWLFASGVEPCCLDGADANDDGAVDVSDASFTLGYLFRGGPAPPPPAGACGDDPTADALGCAGAGACAPASGDPLITEWTVPWRNTRPRDPYVDALGRVWFVGQLDDYAAYLEPESGRFTRFELPAGAGPHNLIVDEHVWYAGNTAAHIGKLDPATGAIEQFPMPDADARDPHTLVFNRDGDIWFTVQSGNSVGRLEVDSGRVDLVRMTRTGSRPYGIALDSNDRPWVVLFGTNRLATVDPATLALEEIPLPRAGARPRRIGVTSDDQVWYVDYAEGYLGHFDPSTRRFDERRLPAGAGARPYGMAVDDRDRVWCVETGVQPNRFVGFDPQSGEFFSDVAIPSGGGTVRHMHYERGTDSVWFGTDAGTIGRAALP